jgi:hypothetical protein
MVDTEGSDPPAKVATCYFTELKDVYALSIRGKLGFRDKNLPGSVKVILIDETNQQEYLVHEAYTSLFITDSDTYDEYNELEIGGEVCEETCILIPPVASLSSLRIEVENGFININDIFYVNTPPANIEELSQKQEELRIEQNERKIAEINSRKLGWVAGKTSVSYLPYREKKSLVMTADSPEVFSLHGFEYYRGGIFKFNPSSDRTLTATQVSNSLGSPLDLLEEFSWTNRDGKNWVTSIKNQTKGRNNCWSICKNSTCPSTCWAFAVAGVMESVLHLYYNEPVTDYHERDLSEQHIVTCSESGDMCSGGNVSKALTHYLTNRIVSEECMAYSPTLPPNNNECQKSCYSPNSISINDYVLEEYSEEQNLKKAIINRGPLISRIKSPRGDFHAMALIGYDTNSNGTIWIFKNSWGNEWGIKLPKEDFCTKVITNQTEVITNQLEDRYGKGGGYVCMKLEHGFKLPSYSIRSLGGVDENQIKCRDEDGDGFCTWGISEYEPKSCSLVCKQGKDCDDSNHYIGGLNNYQCDIIIPPPDPPPPDTNSGCFIATAAYGSYLHPHVEVLRNFKDKYLLNSPKGKLFVESYYRISPPIAAYISKHEALKTLTRWALTPVIYSIEHPIIFWIIF